MSRLGVIKKYFRSSGYVIIFYHQLAKKQFRFYCIFQKENWCKNYLKKTLFNVPKNLSVYIKHNRKPLLLILI